MSLSSTTFVSASMLALMHSSIGSFRSALMIIIMSKEVIAFQLLHTSLIMPSSFVLETGAAVSFRAVVMSFIESEDMLIMLCCTIARIFYLCNCINDTR